MVRLSLKGDFEKARQIHYQLADLIYALFADGSPAGIKAALSFKKLCLDNLRLPLVPANKEVHALINKLFDQIEN